MNALKELCTDWLKAKAAEARANKERVAIEEQIVELVGKRDEGAQTIEQDGFKVTTTGKVTRKMDWSKWAIVKEQIPVNLHPIKTKEELDETGVKYLRDNEPEIYKLLPIETKPAKTSIDVKVLEIPA